MKCICKYTGEMEDVGCQIIETDFIIETKHNYWCPDCGRLLKKINGYMDDWYEPKILDLVI
jgi:hypothetical protein